MDKDKNHLKKIKRCILRYFSYTKKTYEINRNQIAPFEPHKGLTIQAHINRSIQFLLNIKARISRDGKFLLIKVALNRKRRSKITVINSVFRINVYSMCLILCTLLCESCTLSCFSLICFLYLSSLKN